MKNSHARKTTSILFVALMVVALLVGATVAMAQDKVQTTTYFDNAVPGYDAKIRTVNPTGADLYAAIYVVSPDQELSECCSCFVSGGGPGPGILEESVNVDLTRNPANGQSINAGTVTIIGTTVNSAGTAIAPAPGLKTFATHNQFFGGSLVQTETNGQDAPLTPVALAELSNTCQFFISLSGTGICGCGNISQPIHR